MLPIHAVLNHILGNLLVSSLGLWPTEVMIAMMRHSSDRLLRWVLMCLDSGIIFPHLWRQQWRGWAAVCCIVNNEIPGPGPQIVHTECSGIHHTHYRHIFLLKKGVRNKPAWNALIPSINSWWCLISCICTILYLVYSPWCLVVAGCWWRPRQGGPTAQASHSQA